MIAQPEAAKAFAQSLLEIQAVKLRPDQPFTWASGWRSPIYCDNRLTLSFPALRTHMIGWLAAAARAHYPQATLVAGVATAGIPHGALLAQELGLPFAYIRSSAKDHGLTNQIEGRINTEDKVLVIEDLVSTGGSSLKAVAAVRDAGAEVAGMLALFTYGFPLASEQFKAAGVSLITISDYPTLIEVAQAQGYIEAHALETLAQWQQNPAQWLAESI